MEDETFPRYSGVLDAQTEATLRSLTMPTLFRDSDEKAFRLVARVFYSNALFASHFKVMRNGKVVMEDDTPVAADLPVRVDMPVG